MGSDSGTLYIGVTSDLDHRTRQHKTSHFEGFSKTYNCTRLLYYEKHENISQSIAREKQLKGWRREKKLNLIRTQNPTFKDLAEQWGWKFITSHEKISDQDYPASLPLLLLLLLLLLSLPVVKFVILSAAEGPRRSPTHHYLPNLSAARACPRGTHAPHP